MQLAKASGTPKPNKVPRQVAELLAEAKAFMPVQEAHTSRMQAFTKAAKTKQAVGWDPALVAAANKGEEEFQELFHKEYGGSLANVHKAGGGRQAKRAANLSMGQSPKMKADAKGDGTAKPAAQKKPNKVLLFIKKAPMLAKESGEKTHEGRLLDGSTGRVEEGGEIVYMCGQVYRYIVNTPVRVYDSVWEGLEGTGWRRLMPWAGSAHECLRLYVCLFTKSRCTYKEAKEWDDKARDKPFLVWGDERAPAQESTVVEPEDDAEGIGRVVVRGYDLGGNIK